MEPEGLTLHAPELATYPLQNKMKIVHALTPLLELQF